MKNDLSNPVLLQIWTAAYGAAFADVFRTSGETNIQGFAEHAVRVASLAVDGYIAFSKDELARVERRARLMSGMAPPEIE